VFDRNPPNNNYTSEKSKHWLERIFLKIFSSRHNAVFARMGVLFFLGRSQLLDAVATSLDE